MVHAPFQANSVHVRDASHSRALQPPLGAPDPRRHCHRSAALVAVACSQQRSAAAPGRASGLRCVRRGGSRASRQGGAGRVRGVQQGTRQRHATQHGEPAQPCGGRAGRAALRRGTARQEGRSARRDRSAPLQGGVAAGGRHPAAESRAAEECPGRLRALSRAVRRRQHRQADPGYPGSAGQPVPGHPGGQSGGGQRSATEPGVHPDPRAHRWPRRSATARCRQSGRCQRHHAAGGDHPDTTDVDQLHAAGRRSAAGADPLPPGRQARGADLGPW